jgi:hypothetical protein
LIFGAFIFAKVYACLLSLKFFAAIRVAGSEEYDNENQPNPQKEGVFIEDTEAYRRISYREAASTVDGRT